MPSYYWRLRERLATSHLYTDAEEDISSLCLQSILVAEEKVSSCLSGLVTRFDLANRRGKQVLFNLGRFEEAQKWVEGVLLQDFENYYKSEMNKKGIRHHIVVAQCMLCFFAC